MRYCSILLVAALGVTSQVFAADSAPTSELDKLSYSLGAKMGQNLAQQEININTLQFNHGLEDALGNKKLALTEQQMQDTIVAFQNKQIALITERDKKLAVENLAKGKKFLNENKSKPGIKTLPSGLQYEELKAGKGASPKSTDMVTVNYRGTLLDGTEFDSSYSRKEPSTLPLSDLIPGWQEALTLMSPGAKWKVYVPANLAYGEKGAGRVIAPNSTLVFEIELLSVKPSSGKP